MKRKKYLRYIAFFLAINILFEVVSPTVALALTNGPFQPEFGGFEPANSSEMVDLFTGDFKYNIPLMDIDGYPLNMSYHAGQNMESEASWVGHGWSLNPGVINRLVKGLPDDFNGETIDSKTNIKPHISTGVGFQYAAWFGGNLGFGNTGVGSQIGADGSVVLNYNSYKGYGLEIEMDGNLSLTRGIGLQSQTKSSSIGMSLSSYDGGSLNDAYSQGTNVNYGYPILAPVIYSENMGEGTSTNTRNGAITKTYFSSTGISATVAWDGVGLTVGGGVGYTSSLPFGPVSYSPRISNDYTGGGFGKSLKFGLWESIAFVVDGYPLPISIDGGLMLGYKGFYNKSYIKNRSKSLPSYGYMYMENADSISLMDFNRFKDGNVLEQTPNLSFATQTYDLFSATAQGMAANFRTFRSDNGNVFDNYTTIDAANTHDGLEAGGLGIVHVEKDHTDISSNGHSGSWNGFLGDGLKYRGTTSNKFYEKYYFKSMGDITARDAAFEGAVGGEGTVAPHLSKVGADYQAFVSIAGGVRKKRDSRNNYIQSLTAQQATQYGYEPTYDLYDQMTSSSVPVINPNSRLLTANTVNSNINRLTKTIPSSIPNSGTKNIKDHISEISITNTSGGKYVYGIPVYNFYKKRVMFNASDRIEDPYPISSYPVPAHYDYTSDKLGKSHAYQLVNYAKDTATSKEINKNLRGYDNYYREDVTPLYAYNYLLTSILSSDYVDIKGDGPSYDDMGNFTKFNYYKSGEYGWRNPYPLPIGASNPGSEWAPKNNGSPNPNLSGSSDQAQANFEKGMIADELDDKAFYEHGYRENYYVQSIETKNYIAFFITSDRYDQGGSDEHSTSSTNPNLKLDKIKLYSKAEIIVNGIANAVPIKTVRFEYDYSLCPGTFNSAYNSLDNPTRGKLTLKKVYFSYGSSEKSSLSPYEFTYSNNFTYDPRAIDRWGTYMPNSGTETGDPTSNNNTEYPYTNQDSSLTNGYAAAWNINEIKTPSGASIKVTYESDDYGYVQNEQAGQMVDLYNIVNSNVNPALDVTTNYNNLNSNVKDADYIIVDLKKIGNGIPVSGQFSSLPFASNFLKSNVFKLNKDLYFKVFTKLAGPSNAFGLKKDYWDYIPGYATVEEAGLFDATQSGNTYQVGSNHFYRFAYLKIKKEIAYDSKDVFPVSLAGWQLLRNYLPRVAYPGSEPANMGNSGHKPKDMYNNMKSALGVALNDFVNGVSGRPNKRFYDKNFCTTVNYHKSLVRAYVPFKQKVGGGYRVKKIVTSDKWNDMTSSNEATTTFGQSFDYSTNEGAYTISSGVAIYEPIIGGDEISLRQPIDFDIIKSMAPNDHMFQETPYAEMLYPAPMVGYSKVTVRSLPDPENTTVTVCKIGKTEYEFYTAKEFPISFHSTDPVKQIDEGKLIDDYITIPKTFKIFNAAQGHLLKLNDMHGKLKAISVYGEDNLASPISGTRYFYKASGSTKGVKQLITTLPTINENNQISNVSMAKDIDLTVDTGENINESNSIGNTFLFEMGLIIWIITAPDPDVFVTPNIPNIQFQTVYGTQKTGLRQATMTKVVQQYGVLDKVESFDNKATTTMENLLWDQNTGEVVLTRTTNNFNQKIYNFNYPAYWAYPRLSHDFKRDGIELSCKLSDASTVWNVATGVLQKSAIINPTIFDHGDEVMVLDSNRVRFPGRFWIRLDNINISTNPPYYLVDENGLILNTNNFTALTPANYTIKLIEPINQNNLYAGMGSVVSRTDPRTGSAIAYPPGCEIIDANVQEFCSASSLFINDKLPGNQYTNVKSSYYQLINNANNSYSGIAFNPVITGFDATLRPTRRYNYRDKRLYASQPNDITDGFFSAFHPYWTYSLANKKWISNPNVSWQQMSNNKYYSPYGQLVESENAILVPSCQKYCFNHTLPALSASNAKYEEVGFASFEDIGFNVFSYLTNIDATNVYNNDYLGFYGQLGSGSSPVLSANNVAHTGRNSLYFAQNNAIEITHDAYRINPFPSNNDFSAGCQTSVLNLNRLNFSANSTLKKYIVSLWVKGVNPAFDFSNDINLTISMKHNYNNNTPLTAALNVIKKATGIINGWQKVDYEFFIPDGSSIPNTTSHPITSWTNSNVIFNISSTSKAFYMDDFRIQPYNSSMTCNVYDPNQLRLFAQLDDRNYATLLEYDNEGMLVRKKKETFNGVLTVQETRKGLNK